MEGPPFDEPEFFHAISESGVRAVLIGRRALIALGIPVLTADYDFWIAADDIERFNAVAARFSLRPTREPRAARETERYVLENDERIDVLVARQIVMVDGASLSFSEVWGRRVALDVTGGAWIALPCLDDLIATKRVGARPKDVEDIRLLQVLRDTERGAP